jgi:23S rRNA (guanine745-N1)-methyltransferase
MAGPALRCLNGHGFDLSRQGYANLLGGPEPANADTVAMLTARARVHAAGIFDPVAAQVAARVAGRTALLEVGAGTAYYLARALGEDLLAVGVALDVSKAAARAAARTDPRIASVVADVWRPLPVRDRCLDAVLCVFAPRNLPEFARVLRPDGVLVVATPGPGHLAGLRDRHGLLGVPPDKAGQLVAAASEFFGLVDTRLLRHQVPVTAALAGDLIAMGPNAFHRLPEDVAATTVAIDITVQTFRPLSS